MFYSKSLRNKILKVFFRIKDMTIFKFEEDH